MIRWGLGEMSDLLIATNLDELNYLDVGINSQFLLLTLFQTRLKVGESLCCSDPGCIFSLLPATSKCWAKVTLEKHEDEVSTCSTCHSYLIKFQPLKYHVCGLPGSPVVVVPDWLDHGGGGVSLQSSELLNVCLSL